MKVYEQQISQCESEITGLIDILVRENVRRFLEIGSRYGGSLWRIANALPLGSLIVSCDSGSGMGGNKTGQQEALRDCILELKRIGYNAHLIVGDSQLDTIIKQVTHFAPWDACFIDGDHELRGVTRDWKNYGSLSRIVAFHDAGWQMPPGYKNSKVVEVPTLWNELKRTHRHEEFFDRSTGYNYGIGVLWQK